jgi:hypothetical protein
MYGQSERPDKQISDIRAMSVVYPSLEEARKPLMSGRHGETGLALAVLIIAWRPQNAIRLECPFWRAVR